MPGSRRLKTLQLEDNMTFQRREWFCERVGWGVMVLIVIAVLAGLLGSGPLNSVKHDPEEDIRIEYERRLHFGTFRKVVFM